MNMTKIGIAEENQLSKDQK